MRPPASAADLAAPLAIDAGALSSLKQQAKTSPKDALKAAASQFEALFVQMLMKSMRDALPQDGMLSSDTSKTYQSMFDQQIAMQMSKSGGIGLAKVLEKQLAPAIKGAAPEGDAAAAAKVARAGTAHVHAASAANASATLSDSHAAAHEASRSSVPANVRSFIDKMRPYAEAAAQAVGVPADLLLAQAGLETGWGRSQPKAADGSTSHNLFGVKAGKSWNGAVAVASTTEYVAGAVVRTVDRFRSYHSYTEAFQDFGRLITGNARYSAAVAKTDDPAAYARGLQKGGYATDPQYADKLMRAIHLVSRHAHDQAHAAQVVAAAAVNKQDDPRDAARTRT
jgi:flagellar protein FlgJ